MAATSEGLRIFMTSEKNENEIEKVFVPIEGGAKLGEMLFKSQYMLFVGTGENKDHPVNQLTIWDDQKKSVHGRLPFNYEILNTKIRRDR